VLTFEAARYSFAAALAAFSAPTLLGRGEIDIIDDVAIEPVRPEDNRARNPVERRRDGDAETLEGLRLRALTTTAHYSFQGEKNRTSLGPERSNLNPAISARSITTPTGLTA